MGRQVRADDVVRSTDTTEEIQVETSDISNKFKFFETYKEPEKERKQFRITPPRDGQVKVCVRQGDEYAMEDHVLSLTEACTAPLNSIQAPRNSQ
ncbi:Protein of unknown function [Cotesia congregata]|uniref:Uncharacterized protein n=1 Tax=Cotesia congregata TaxID=51543 RepID=A0A8J2E9E8_COTCN|nr:Protein of unknown function [Cotesia congregata]